jgi:hypothetical protein
VAWAATAAIEHGPEALSSFAAMQVEVEHFELLRAEWANHPLLDFIQWQSSRAGEVMAMTLPQEALAGHSALAGLLKRVLADGVVAAELDRIATRPDFAGWAADEFRHGLAHARVGEFDRAVGPLTLGLEGLIRASAASLGLLDEVSIKDIRSGSQLVKRLWGRNDRYRPYMESWVFGLANAYRQGSDRRDASAQALHAICGAAIWADHILGEPAALQTIHDRLAEEVRHQYLQGWLQVQPQAEARLNKAAEKAERSDAVKQMLELREQLLEIRTTQRRGLAATGAGGSPPHAALEGGAHRAEPVVDRPSDTDSRR